MAKENLLFTKVNNDILILDIIENGNYQNSFYFKRKPPKQIFLAALHFNQEESISQDFFVACTDEDIAQFCMPSGSSTGIEYVPFHNDHDKFIEFTDEQNAIINDNSPGNMNVIGPPGSGKTATAKKIINTRRQQGNILYLAPSAELAQTTEMDWCQSPESQEPHGRVFFRSWEKWYKMMEPHVKWTGQKECLEWIKARCTSNQNQQLSDTNKNAWSNITRVFKNKKRDEYAENQVVMAIYQEFLTISSYFPNIPCSASELMENETSYTEPKKLSHFPPDVRKAIYEVFTKYLD
ncbi:MAG TPA: hypothetical protein VHD33_06885, partial [Legionellaceae bacterium]|nr:hypothetical protein [Legionellaceae bacterium]